MVILRAKGKKYGKVISVVCKCQDGKKPIFCFNGKENKYCEQLVFKKLKERYPVGGTYYPEENETLNVYNVLENYFFDVRVKVKVEGDMPTLPYEEGVIY